MKVWREAIRALRPPLRGAHAGSCLNWRDIRGNRSLDGIHYRKLSRNESNLAEIAGTTGEKCCGACVNVERSRALHKDGTVAGLLAIRAS
jgi:hypothetical protein